MDREKILVGWTTADSARAAQQLAVGLVAVRLAACVQVDGPMTSHYSWKGKQEAAKEWRVWVKFPSRNAEKIEAWLRTNHPYSTPQWLAVTADKVAIPYHQWILENTRKPAIPRKKK